MEPMTIREILEAVNGSLLGDFGDLNRQVVRVEVIHLPVPEQVRHAVLQRLGVLLFQVRA